MVEGVVRMEVKVGTQEVATETEKKVEVEELVEHQVASSVGNLVEEVLVVTVVCVVVLEVEKLAGVVGDRMEDETVVELWEEYLED